MRILFITATRIGDAILSTGLLSHLIARHPRARFTVAAGPAAAPLFAAMPGLEELVVMQKAPLSAHWAKLWLHCVGRRWDLVVDLRRSAIAWLLAAGERRIVPPQDGALHRVEFLAKTLDLADPPAPTLWWSAADGVEAARLVPGGGPVLAVGAAANWVGKQWRAERFAELVGRLTGPGGILPGARVAVFAAPQEREQVAPVLAALDDTARIDLVGRTPLPVAAACLERCALFIGNDSGLMHMAAAVGIPTLGLFGPSHAEHYAPWGARTAWVRTEKRYDELVGTPGYDHRTTGTLMDSLTVYMAERAATDLWRRVHPEPTGAACG
jgi:heptosyltransferase-3